MIVILDCPAFLDGAEIAAALAARMGGQVVDLHAVLGRGALDGEGTLEQQLHRALVAGVVGLQDRGARDVVVWFVFHEPAALARMREVLRPLDPVIRAVRLRHDLDELARRHDTGDAEALSDTLDLYDQWRAARGAGLDVAAPCEAGAAAAALWTALQDG